MGTHIKHVLQNQALNGFKIVFSVIIVTHTSLHEVPTIQLDIFKKQYSLEL